MRKRRVLLPLAGALTLAFLYLPVLVMAGFSFNEGRYASHWTGFSPKWYGELFDPWNSTDRLAAGLGEPLALSLKLGACAALVGVVLAALTAVGLNGARRAVAIPLVALWALPIALPDVVLGVSWRGAFERLGVPEGFPSLLLAHATMAAAFGLVVVRARLATLDPALVEAARDLGASRAGAVRHVVIPHLRPALLAAALLGFTLSFDDFMVTFFLAPATTPTLPVRVYGYVTKGASPVLPALATLSLLGTFLVAFVAMRLVRPADVRA